jgi:2-haloacid dehalogenase
MPDPIDARSPTSRPAAVVFDLGGVLIDWNPRYLYRKLFAGDDAAMERFLGEVATAEWNAEQDRGRPWEDAVTILSREHPDDAALIAAYHARWVEMLGGPIEGTVEILAELRREEDLRLLALTNWSAETFPIARPDYPFLEWFEAIVVSGEVRLMKPDPVIFRHLIAEHALEPATTLFIDDSDANIAAARDLGFGTIRFTSPDKLRAQLQRVGLLVRS